MKKIAICFTVILLCFLFTECDDQLNLAPLGQLDENTYYQNERDFEAASLSPYSTLLNLYYDQGGLGWYQGILYPDDDVVVAGTVGVTCAHSRCVFLFKLTEEKHEETALLGEQGQQFR